MAEHTTGQDPRHPKSTYEAKYPFNRVEVTESGHEIHFDDTPGKERIRQAHKSGSYYEISPDGKKTEMIVAHSIQYVKGGQTITVDKNVDTKVGGSTRSSVSGDSHSEVKGTSSQAIGGDLKTTVGGDSVSAVKGDMVTAVVGSFTGKFGGGANSKVDGNMKFFIDGEGELKFGKDLLISSETKITLVVGQSKIIMEPDRINIEQPNESGGIFIYKRVYLGYEKKDDKEPPIKNSTVAGPSKQVWSKPG